MKEAGPRYAYYSSRSTSSDFQRTRKGCEELGRLRLNPSLSDPDYLIFKCRRPIIEKWCAAIIDSDLVILDIGGRIQPYRSFLQARTKHYIAVDLLMEGLVNVIATGERLPFRDGCADVVLSNDALQYIPNPAWAINEMHRVLRTGGRMILSTRGSYPEHHDEYWRFIPNGLRHLCSAFSKVEIVPEEYSWAGTCISMNVLLHRDICADRIMQVAKRTTIPFINLLGLQFDRYFVSHTRSTCGYSLLAIK